MRRIKTRGFLLLALGILIQTASFFGDHATDVPFILNRLAPFYCEASYGVGRLETTGSLSESDQGFAQISALLITDLRRDGRIPVPVPPDTRVAGILVESQIIMGYGPIRTGNIKTLHFTVFSPLTLGYSAECSYDLEQLKSEVEDTLNPNLFSFCCTLFVLGSVVALMGFFIDPPKEAGGH